MPNTTIRHPLEWGYDQLRHGAAGFSRAVRSVHPTDAAALPRIRQIGLADLRDALAKGVDDFAACRSDVVFLSVIYPVVGLVLWRLVIAQGMFQLLFPLASGFALIGPFVAIGLYEMSRRREQGATISWADAFSVLRAPSSGAMAILGILLMAIFVFWLVAAQEIYDHTMGPGQPASFLAFAHDIVTTTAGWTLIVVGVGLGFLFAVLVLVITAISFPLLLDRPDAGLDIAIATSVRTVLANKRTMAIWGLTIAAALVLGSIPLLLGLAVVMPVLGHATWHLYRKAVV